MTVQAGESPAPAQVAPAMVDAAALANSIVNAVAQIQMSAPQSAPQVQTRPSAFQAKAEKFLKEERMDKDVMPVMLELIEAAKADISEEAKQEILKRGQEEQTKQIHSELGRMVERFGASSANPDLIRELKVSIAQNAINEYNSNAGLVNRYKTTGQIDWNELEKTVVKQVNKWAGTKAGNEDKPAGGPAMKNEAPAGALETRGEMSKDMLDERQQEIFNSQTDFAIKQMGMTRADAEKRALEKISNAESRLKARK